MLGAQLTDEDGTVVDFAEPRIKAGVLLAAPGNGGADLSTTAYDSYPFFRKPNFLAMTTPTLVVVGGRDLNPYLSVRGADWTADSYHLSTGPKCLLTIAGSGHLLGGVSGYDAAETTDENPERVATVQRMSLAYLKSTLYPGDRSWSLACESMETLGDVGRVECK